MMDDEVGELGIGPVKGTYSFLKNLKENKAITHRIVSLYIKPPSNDT